MSHFVVSIFLSVLYFSNSLWANDLELLDESRIKAKETMVEMNSEITAIELDTAQLVNAEKDKQNKIRMELKACKDLICVNEKKNEIQKIDKTISLHKFHETGLRKKVFNRYKHDLAFLAARTMASEFFVAIDENQEYDLLPSQGPYRCPNIKSPCSQLTINFVYGEKIFETRIRFDLEVLSNHSHASVDEAYAIFLKPEGEFLYLILDKDFGLKKLLFEMKSHWSSYNRFGYHTLSVKEI